MRNRAIEIAAALAGVAVVVGLYLSRSGGEVPAGAAPAPSAPPEVRLPDPASRSEPTLPQPRMPAAAEREEGGAAPAADRTSVDPAALGLAQRQWEAAVAEVAAVERELDRVDGLFDVLEEEFARREDAGEDPDALDEEIARRLEEIVGQYEEWERKLVEVEGAEVEAAARLKAAGGSPG